MAQNTRQGFQTQVGVMPAPAVEGDFASTNPRFSAIAGPGGFVAGALGVVIGRFVWEDASAIDPDNEATIVNNFVRPGQLPTVSQPLGLVHREQQGLITAYLAEAGMTIPQGFGVSVFTGGDFWVKNAGTGQALRGQKVYANFKDGSISFGATASPGTASTTGTIVPAGGTVTGSITGNVLTVTVLTSGSIVPGALLTGTGGGGVATGTKVVSQLSGTLNGVGTYAVSIPEQTVTSTTISAAYGLMNITAVASGTLEVGDTLTGTGGGGLTASSQISALGTGVGNTGTYYVDQSQNISSTTITAARSYETKWYAMTSGAAGELVKITAQPLG